MDEYERFMSRERAKWRAKRKGKKRSWGWLNGKGNRRPHEEHHIGKRKYSPLTIPVPRAVHHELTRRQDEEHPPEGPDPTNPNEIAGRMDLGCADLHEWFADVYRERGEARIAAAKRGKRDLIG